MDEVAENSDELMERYLEGEEISHEEIVTALKKGVTRGAPVPGHLRRRDQEPGHQPPARGAGRGRPLARDAGRGQGPRRRGRGGRDRAGPRTATWSPTCSRPPPIPTPGASTCSASTRASCAPTRRRSTPPAGRRSGSASSPRRAARRPPPSTSSAPGDIGAVAKLRETRAGDVLAAKDAGISFPPLDLPAPVMAFAFEPKSKGDEEKAAAAHPPPRPRRTRPSTSTATRETGEQIIAGLTQVHVEVIVERMKRRYRRRDRAPPAARALPGDDPQARQGPRPLQEADRRPRPVRRLPHRDRAGRGRGRVRVRQRDQGRRDPRRASSPRSRRGSPRRWSAACWPATR